MKLILELLGLYLLYKLIFDFIIPIANTTKQVKQQFGDMQDCMKEQMNEFNRAQSNPNTHTSSPKAEDVPTPRRHDYIEFEEVKG